MAPHPIPLPCALAFPPPSHRDATTPSPCWAPHFMTQERIMFSNPTPSEPRLSPAATMSDATGIVSHSILALRLHLATCSQIRSLNLCVFLTFSFSNIFKFIFSHLATQIRMTSYKLHLLSSLRGKMSKSVNQIVGLILAFVIGNT